MVAEREVFIKEHGGTKNGFYERDLGTTLGKLENLKVSRDRKGKFRTKLMEPYKRRDISLENPYVQFYVFKVSKFWGHSTVIPSGEGFN